MQLPVRLTEVEMALYGRSLAIEHQALRAAKVAHKAELDGLKERQRDREGRIQATLDELAERVRAGKELRDVEVREVKNYETRRLEVTRLDTGERVPEKERDLRPDEYQQQLPLDEARATWAQQVGAEMREARNPIGAIVQQSVSPIVRWCVYSGARGERTMLLDRVTAESALAACRCAMESRRRMRPNDHDVGECWAEPETAEEADLAIAELNSVQERLAEVAATKPSAGLPLDSELKAQETPKSWSKATRAKRQAARQRRAEIEREAQDLESHGARRKHEDGE